jgi:hypothetical protein
MSRPPSGRRCARRASRRSPFGRARPCEHLRQHLDTIVGRLGKAAPMAGNTRQRRAGSRTGRRRTVRPAPAAGDRKRGDPGPDGSRASSLVGRSQRRFYRSISPVDRHSALLQFRKHI